MIFIIFISTEYCRLKGKLALKRVDYLITVLPCEYNVIKDLN